MFRVSDARSGRFCVVGSRDAPRPAFSIHVGRTPLGRMPVRAGLGASKRPTIPGDSHGTARHRGSSLRVSGCRGRTGAPRVTRPARHASHGRRAGTRVESATGSAPLVSSRAGTEASPRMLCAAVASPNVYRPPTASHDVVVGPDSTCVLLTRLSQWSRGPRPRRAHENPIGNSHPDHARTRRVQ